MHALRRIYWDSACFVTGAVGGRCNNARCESLSLSGVETYKRTVYDHSLKHASCKMDPTRPDAILYHARTAGELFKRVRTVPYRTVLWVSSLCLARTMHGWPCNCLGDTGLGVLSIFCCRDTQDCEDAACPSVATFPNQAPRRANQECYTVDDAQWSGGPPCDPVIITPKETVDE